MTEELEKLYAEQHGACAICGTVDEELILDADRDTKEPRGLLCGDCHYMIRICNEDAQTVQNMISYFEYHHERKRQEARDYD